MIFRPRCVFFCRSSALVSETDDLLSTLPHALFLSALTAGGVELLGSPLPPSPAQQCQGVRQKRGLLDYLQHHSRKQSPDSGTPRPTLHVCLLWRGSACLSCVTGSRSHPQTDKCVLGGLFLDFIFYSFSRPLRR